MGMILMKIIENLQKVYSHLALKQVIKYLVTVITMIVRIRFYKKFDLDNQSHNSEINPKQFKLGDDLSKFNEDDFSNNESENVAHELNRGKKAGKIIGQNFEKKHDLKLNQDLDIHSEQSVRIDQADNKNKKTRPKTAKFKEKSKPGQPGADDIALSYSRQKPITEDKDIELARKKMFKKLREDKKKQKQLISKAVKKHVKKAPNEKEPKTRPKSSKKQREVVIDDNNENEYEKFINGKQNLLRLNLVNQPKKGEEEDPNTKKLKKLENGWVGVGIGSGKFGEDELKRDIKKKKEYRSILIEEYLLDKPKPADDDYPDY